jgi:hypothetical protein
MHAGLFGGAKGRGIGWSRARADNDARPLSARSVPRRTGVTVGLPNDSIQDERPT